MCVSGLCLFRAFYCCAMVDCLPFLLFLRFRPKSHPLLPVGLNFASKNKRSPIERFGQPVSQCVSVACVCFEYFIVVQWLIVCLFSFFLRFRPKSRRNNFCFNQMASFERPIYMLLLSFLSKLSFFLLNRIPNKYLVVIHTRMSKYDDICCMKCLKNNKYIKYLKNLKLTSTSERRKLHENVRYALQQSVLPSMSFKQAEGYVTKKMGT